MADLENEAKKNTEKSEDKDCKGNDALSQEFAALIEAKKQVVMPSKVIEVPASDLLDSPDWHKHTHEPPQGLPGEFIKQGPRPHTPSDSDVVAALNKISGSEMKDELDQLSGNTDMLVGGRTHRLEGRSTLGTDYKVALDFYKDKFEKLGYTVSLDTYTRRGQNYYNLRAMKLGTSQSNEIVMYGAHIDSTAGWPWYKENKAPGANDDGSGVVALSQIAKAIKDLPLDRSVVFSLFSGEEQGLWGSRAMAELYRQAQVGNPNDAAQSKPKIVGMYQIDMIGYNPKNSKAIESHDTTSHKPSQALTEIMARNQQRYGIDLKVYGAHNEELTERSDHYPFYANGIPAVLITEPYDTAEEHNPNYHSTNDVVSSMNIPYMVNVTKLMAASGIELAGMKGSLGAKGTVKDQAQQLMSPQNRITWDCPKTPLRR